MKNLTIIIVVGVFLSMACSGTNEIKTANGSTQKSENKEVPATSTSRAANSAADINTTMEKLSGDFKRNATEMDALLKDKMIAVSGKAYTVESNYIVFNVNGRMAGECKRSSQDGSISWDSLEKEYSKAIDANMTVLVTMTGKYTGNRPPDKNNVEWRINFEDCRVDAVVKGAR